MYKRRIRTLSMIIIIGILALSTMLTLYYASPGMRHEKFIIVCTTNILADALQSIAGDCAHVLCLMAPGVDPHTYKARESDLQKLLNADLIVYHGLHLEGKIANIFEHMVARPTRAATETIARKYLLTSDEYCTIYDPHIWFDVNVWMQVIMHLCTILQEYDPKHASVYTHNTKLLLSHLQELDTWIYHQIALIPEDRRILITAHDAFAYFGRRYSVRVIGLQGISTDSEPGITDIQSLTQVIVERHITTLFVETSVPIRALQAVQEAAAAQHIKVSLSDALYSDTLGIVGSNADTYCSMMHHNVQAIVNGLRN